MAIVIAPSILSADLARLADEIREAEEAGADRIHVDVMDGRFVPNITVGIPVLEAIRKVTTLPLDVHLMMVEPERYVQSFAKAGADTVGIHVEASPHLQRTLATIREQGKRACAVLNPHTPATYLEHVLADLDQVLVMTVNPGFSGQSFLPAVLPKIATVRAMISDAKLAIDIAVDGGVGADTAAQVVRAGGRVLIAGSAVFGQRDRRQAIAVLRQQAEAGLSS